MNKHGAAGHSAPPALALDTAPAAEARQIAGFRLRTPEERLTAAFQLGSWAMAASRDAIRRAQPSLSALEQAQLLYGLQFGSERAHQVRRALELEGPMTIPAAMLPVVEVLEQLHVRYYIGGSIASIAYSLPRTTYDVDMLAALAPQHAATFIQSLQVDYYVDIESLLEAIAHRSSFNMTHQATHINIDVFVSAGRPFDDEQLRRVRPHLLPGAGRTVNLASPEDIILNKLAWFELGNRVSDQQWRDIQSILRVQGDALDLPYLRQWALDLGLGALLDLALRGERPGPDATTQQHRLL